MKHYLETCKGALKKLSKKTYIAIFVVLVLIAAVITLVLYNRPYAVLFTELNSEEASSIISYLESQGVRDYRLENGDTILVPKAQEYTLKGKLMMEGYPKSGFAYSTYYDHVGSLSTESERNRSYLIMTQERIAAAIRCLEGVKDATVNITQGENRGYVLDSGNVVEATAAVIVTMRDGQTLSKKMVGAIRNYVAHSVSGLTINEVSISDSYGNQYNVADDNAVSGEASQLKLQLEEQYDNKIRGEILKVLVPIFGPDNVRVAVTTNVDINHTVVNSKDVELPDWAADGSTKGQGIIGSIVYDHSVIRDGDETPGGVVGTGSNADLPTYVEPGDLLNGNEDEVHLGGQVDYNNSQKDTFVERTAGCLTDCMVAVTINSTKVRELDVTAIREHVARAAGIYDDLAASKISILSTPFYTPEIIPPIVSEYPEWILYAAIGGLALFLVLLALILIIRGRRKKKKKKQQPVLEEQPVVIPVEPKPVGADVMAMRTEKSMELRKDIRKFADENPEIAAQMVRSWLKGGDNDG